MTNQDLKNDILQRMRQAGVNWGGTAANTAANLVTPYQLQLEINKAYNRGLALIKDFPIATLEVSFLTTANTSRFSLNPCPTSDSAVGSFNQVGSVQTGTNYSLPSPPKVGDTVAILFSSATSAVPVITDSNGVALTQRETQADPINNSSITVFDYVVTTQTTGNFASTLIATNFMIGYELASVGAGVFSKASGTSATLTMTQTLAVGALQIGALIAQTSTPALALSNGTSTADASTATYAIGHAVATAAGASTATASGVGALAAIYVTYPPAEETIYNPCAMQIYEFKYTQAGGQVRYIPFVSDTRYRQITAGYNQIQGSYAAYPNVLRQSFGQRVIDAWPGYGTGGDKITLTICPDPMSTANFYSNTQVTAAQGNVLSADGDIPLFPEQFHQIIAEGATMSLARMFDKQKIYDNAKGAWGDFAQEMLDFGSSVAEGDAEQRVQDPWSTWIDTSGYIF